MAAYLDYNATAPIEPAAIEAMTRAAEAWGNPSSVHADGRRGKAMLEDARRRIADGLGCRASELVFTSGGTESLALALRGVAAVLASATEHDAVRRQAPQATRISVDHDGVIDLGALDRMLNIAAPGALVAVMHANNETGVIQPIAEVVAICRRYGARTLVDAVQTAGRMALPEGDLVAVSAHKLGGPPGAGALIVRDFKALVPIGGQERGYRAGTENLPAIMGLAAAVEARVERGWLAPARRLRDRLESALDAQINGAGAERLPTTSSIRMPGVPAATQVIAFDLAGYRVSAGAACSSGKVSVSHVLAAMGVDGADESIRVSLGWNTTEAEIDGFIDAWRTLAARRAAA